MKKLLLLGIVALIGVFSINAQNYSDEIFTAVEQPAYYPGGEAELLKWIGQNIQYPPMAAEEGAQGRVVVQFVVEKDGRVGHVKVVRGRHPELDKEAIRVVKSIKTRFIPGKNNNQPVRHWFTLPINFKLCRDEEKEPQTQQ